jgi:hypothetical protein
MHSTNIVEHAIVILKCMINEHVVVNVASLSIQNLALVDFEIEQNTFLCFGN